MIILDIDKPERCGKCPMHHDGNDYCKLAHDHASFVRAKGCPIQTIKTGHWEWVQYESNPNIGNFHCSECRFIPLKISNYCSNCGCYMVKTQESEGIRNERIQ